MLMSCSHWYPGNKPLHDQREWLKNKDSTKFKIGPYGYHIYETNP